MCFSATASFVASGALLMLGAATYAAARKKDKILIAIPLLFGVQQAFEGVQWLYLNRGSHSPAAGYGFLFFALIVWPVYVPVFLYMLDERRKKIMTGLMALGGAVAVYFAWVLVTHPLHVRIKSDCVYYGLELPKWWMVAPPYLVAVLGALFASSRAAFRWFGAAIAVMSVIAAWMYKANFISVWCFFAAAVSSLFFLYVQHRRSLRNRLLHAG